jgi:hypothetical protein
MDQLFVMTRGRRDIHLYPLKQTLAQALATCRQFPGRKVKIPLSSGLVIVLYVEAQGTIHVLLSRSSGVPPGANEAVTVFKHWPEPAPLPDWHSKDAGPFKCLVAEWTPPPAQLGFDAVEGAARRE